MPRPILLARLAAPCLAAGLAACGAAVDDPSDDRRLDGPVPEPVAGELHVVSRFEVPATAAAPGPLGDVLRLVHGLTVDPGAALLDFAEDAGVPALSELRLVLPDSLESRLAKWIGDALRSTTVDGVAPLDGVAEVDAVVRSVLLRWDLHSTLALPEGRGGTHAPMALAFESPAGPVVVPLDATAPVTAGVDVVLTVSWPAGPSGAAAATISDHFMGVPFGRYALEGLDAVLLARLGAPDLRSALGEAVGCAAVAAEVARRCVGPVCVGHAAELFAICEAGVDEAASRVEAKVLELDFRAIHLERGEAVAVGARPETGGAGATTALAGGTWTASVDLGQGPEAAVATFAASR